MDPAPAAPPAPAAGTEQPSAPAPSYNTTACRLALVPLAAWTLLSLLLSPWLIASTFFLCNEVEIGRATSFTPVALNANCDLAVTTPSGTFTVTQRCSTLAQCQDLQRCPNVQLARNHYQPKRCAYIVSGPDGDADTQLPQAMPWYVVNAWMHLGLAAVIWVLVVMSAAWVAAAASAVLQEAARPHSKWTWTGVYSRLQAAADTELTASTKERHDGADAANAELGQGPQQPKPQTPQLSSSAITMDSVEMAAGICAVLLSLWFIVSLVMSLLLFPATFSCNEVLHGRATSIQRGSALALQGALCDVGVQLEDASSHAVTLPCSHVAPCEANLSACTNLQVAVNHLSRRLCLQIMVGGSGNNDDGHEHLSQLPYRYMVLWNCVGFVLFLACISLLVLHCCDARSAIPRLLSRLFPPLDTPLGGPRGSGGSVRAEDTLAQASTHLSSFGSKDTNV